MGDQPPPRQPGNDPNQETTEAGIETGDETSDYMSTEDTLTEQINLDPNTSQSDFEPEQSENDDNKQDAEEPPPDPSNPPTRPKRGAAKQGTIDYAALHSGIPKKSSGQKENAKTKNPQGKVEPGKTKMSAT